MNATDLQAYGQMLAALDAEAFYRASQAESKHNNLQTRAYWAEQYTTAITERDEMWNLALEDGFPPQVLLIAVNAATYVLARTDNGTHPTAAPENYPPFPGLESVRT